MKKILFIVSLFFSTAILAQVQLKVDTTHIRIGEQIQYELSTASDSNVIFPKLQLDSLHKIEVVHSLPVDTLKNRLYKKYILTGFDSGVYKIPGQDVMINQQHYISDSLLIHVGTVAVDTTKQGLFPIKPIYKAAPKTSYDYLYLLWWFIGVVLLVVVLIWIIKHRKNIIQQKAQRQLSPIEEASAHLQSLDSKQLIEQQKIKEYYIELTDIVRNYIGKDVHIPTLEVTTEELITLLEIHNKSNKLGIDKTRIKELHQFLKNADLVKFAKAKPEQFQIKEDRQTAEDIIKEIQSIVHQPKRDEFGNIIEEESEEELQAKSNKKRRLLLAAAGLLLIVLLSVASISYYGFTYVKDTITGHPTKELLEGKWYYSTYGYPAVGLESPVVLKAVQLPFSEETRQAMNSSVSFGYGSISSGFYLVVNTNEIQSEKELNLDMFVDSAVEMMQQNKQISNFDYTTKDTNNNDITGKIISGSFSDGNRKLKLTQYIFLQDNAVQQVAIIRQSDDTYADSIAKRIEKSIQLEKSARDDDDEN